MLPSRAYANNLPPISPGSSAVREPAVAPAATILVATRLESVDLFTVSSFTRVAVHSTADALKALERTRPRVIAVDWDCADIDAAVVCRHARQLSYGGILVVTDAPQHAPDALRAGCHTMLLRPFAPNLLAARVGRLSRELAAALPLRPASSGSIGTNRTWPNTHCPACAAGGAVSFEFSSYRRMWYACLGCDHVWLGRRQE